MQPKDIFVAHPKKPQKASQQKQKSTDSLPQKAKELITELNQPLLTVKSFFPFDLFPDQLIINTVEIIFIYKMFFLVSYRTSMLIDDIGDITLTQGPLFATLTITPTSHIKGKPIHISWLTRGDAQKAHNLLQGLVTLKSEKVDIEKVLSTKKGREEIMTIGKTKK